MRPIQDSLGHRNIQHTICSDDDDVDETVIHRERVRHGRGCHQPSVKEYKGTACDASAADPRQELKDNILRLVCEVAVWLLIWTND
jgi:hypothetical protein